MKCVVATIKSCNITNFYKLQDKFKEHEFLLIQNKEELNSLLLKTEYKNKHKADYIFFPHWSWIIPKEIYDSFNCVVFHMTDLPFGRGGSPLQNLLVRGIYETKISAIKVCAGIDTGPIYFKESVNISTGNADEILSKISDIVFEKMIPRFLNETIIPVEQSGEAVTFKRRTPEQSEIPSGLSSRQVYDFIRMLDGEGYPTAFMARPGGGKIFFTGAQYNDAIVTAKARFSEDIE